MENQISNLGKSAKSKLEPDVALGKIFIGVYIFGFLFVIISIVIVYFKANNDQNCTSGNQNTVDNTPHSKSSSLKNIIFIFIFICIISAITSESINFSSKPKINVH